MNSKASKTAFLFALYLAAHFAAACGPICDCPNIEFPYFDYKTIALETNSPVEAGLFTIKITPDSVQFVAQATPRFQFISSAYACSCNEAGDQGDKYAPVAMDIFADRDYNDTLPAGASLRSIFFGQTQGDIVTMLTPTFRPEKFNYRDNYYTIRTNVAPKYLGEPYHFQVQWVKSNGDTLLAETNAVIFN